MGLAEQRTIQVGCAGWGLPRDRQDQFPPEGSHLERYATRFPAVEINSSFYRRHRPATYARWRDSVPEDFRFSAKLPRRITHELRLRDATEPLDELLADIGGLGRKLGPLLVQLPPSLAFEAEIAEGFFRDLAARTPAPIVCEPRHASWFTECADELLARMDIGRVAADPAVVPEAAWPSGAGIVYYRLHGSPRTYYSAYSEEFLEQLAGELRQHSEEGREVWCIFDNTASGAATGDALTVRQHLREDQPSVSTG
jgi:uncharacterized protein YecE (DUF72 family)